MKRWAGRLAIVIAAGCRASPGTPEHAAQPPALVHSPTPDEASPEPEERMPAKFTAESDPPDDEGERGATMTVAIELGGTRSVLVLESGLGPCEDVSAVVEPVPDSGGRVALANLACDNGEDFATKESLTALIIVGSDGAARVAWQGESLSRRDISCYTNDTVHFEMRGGRVAVIRTKETYGEDRARHR